MDPNSYISVLFLKQPMTVMTFSSAKGIKLCVEVCCRGFSQKVFGCMAVDGGMNSVGSDILLC